METYEVVESLIELCMKNNGMAGLYTTNGFTSSTVDLDQI